MKGMITSIQRFSLNDGDGIRTTVFFKGCNMRCSWCHNPETICNGRELMFYETKCIGCGKCFANCPNGAHQIVNGQHVIDRKLCINCGICADSCYAQALVMCGTEMSIEELMKEIRQDKAYYQSSGGGVTLSGGEVLCQRDFAIALCEACHKEEIPVAVETNLCFSYEYARELLEKVDLIMCDLKIFDKEAHKLHTGVTNEMILDNIRKLDQLGIPVIVRTPLIPGATDTQENLTSITAYIKNLQNLRRYEVLNFNPLGAGKYKSLDRANAFESSRPFGEEKLAEVEAILKTAGIPYKIV